MIRASRLDPALYEEVEADSGAFRQAVAVVVLSSIAAGIGVVQKAGASGILAGALSALISWLVWSYIIFIIGGRLLPEPQTSTDYGELLRTIGFASAPGLIRVLGVIPGFAGFIFLLASIWMVAAMVVGVRQALDYKSTLRAVAVCVAGWIVQAVILGIILYFAGRM